MYNIKTSLLVWWFLIILAVFFWYRDYKYDRVIAAVTIVLAMLHLTEYGVYNNMEPKQAARLIFCIIWLLLFIFALATLIFVKNSIALIWLIIITILFLMAIFYAFASDNDIKLEYKQRLVWFSVLRGLEWFFVLAIIVPVCLLLDHYSWLDLDLYIVLIYLTISVLVVHILFPAELFLSNWIYSLTGLVLLIWFIGTFTI